MHFIGFWIILHNKTCRPHTEGGSRFEPGTAHAQLLIRCLMCFRGLFLMSMSFISISFSFLSPSFVFRNGLLYLSVCSSHLLKLSVLSVCLSAFISYVVCSRSNAKAPLDFRKKEKEKRFSKI